MTRRPVCTPTEAKKALSMWRRYKTDTAEYKRLAESLCVNTAELNAFCSQLNRDQKARDAASR
jgi:hypothetical protein